MSKKSTFIPHVWGENIDKKENDGNITDLFNILSEDVEDNDSHGIEDNLFDKILNRVENDAVDETNDVAENSFEEDETESESTEGDGQSYTQGFMDGVNKQRDDTEEELINASEIVTEIAATLASAKVELDKSMESAIKNYVTNISRNVLGDIFDDNMDSIIQSRLNAFIHENNLFDYEITVDINEGDYKLFEKVNESDISYNSSSGLKRGQAHLVAKKEQQRFEAEFDLHKSLSNQLEAL